MYVYLTMRYTFSQFRAMEKNSWNEASKVQYYLIEVYSYTENWKGYGTVLYFILPEMAISFSTVAE